MTPTKSSWLHSPLIALAVGVWYLPESPRWLAKNGQAAEALQVLGRLRSEDGQVNEEAQREVNIIFAVIQRSDTDTCAFLVWRYPSFHQVRWCYQPFLRSDHFHLLWQTSPIETCEKIFFAPNVLIIWLTFWFRHNCPYGYKSCKSLLG